MATGSTLGRVKWFNSRKGFGFLTTLVAPDETPTDVFVHHSNVRVADEQYKYLVEGEYVSFTLTETSDDEHKHQASNVTGVLGGKLMCETRNDNRDSQQHGPPSGPSSASEGQGQGQGPPSGGQWSTQPRRGRTYERTQESNHD